MPPSTTDSHPFPTDALLPWQADMVRAVSANAQTDPAMGGMFCLGFCSFAVGRNVMIRGADGTVDPLALWVVVIAESGEGKSRTFAPLLAPLARIDRALRGRAVEPEPTAPPDVSVGRPSWERLMSDDLLEVAERSPAVAARRVGWATQDAVTASLVAEQAAHFPNAPLRFWERSITPEALVEAIANQVPGVLQASPEAQLFSHVAAGGARAMETLSHYNSMWSGEDIHVSRIGRAASSAIRPVLSLVAAPQPEALAEIRAGRLGRLVERTGFLMRCWFAQPTSNVGLQTPRRPPIPDGVRLQYEENLRAMFAVANTNTAPTHTLRLESYDAWDEYFRDVERRRARGGDLHEVAGWATRVRQATARIAGMLHIAAHAGEYREATFGLPVSNDIMERAITIGRWQLEHGRAVLLAEPASAPTARESAPDLLGLIRAVVAARGEWVGTATELLEALRRASPNNRDLPSLPNQLTRLLGQMDLHAAGVRMSEERRARSRAYRLTLLTEADPNSSSSPSSC